MIMKFIIIIIFIMLLDLIFETIYCVISSIYFEYKFKKYNKYHDNK